jgi:hypothetical protein
MRIQSFLTAAAINLKRLAIALLALMWALADVHRQSVAAVSRIRAKDARSPQLPTRRVMATNQRILQQPL